MKVNIAGAVPARVSAVTLAPEDGTIGTLGVDDSAHKVITGSGQSIFPGRYLRFDPGGPGDPPVLDGRVVMPEQNESMFSCVAVNPASGRALLASGGAWSHAVKVALGSGAGGTTVSRIGAASFHSLGPRPVAMLSAVHDPAHAPGYFATYQFPSRINTFDLSAPDGTAVRTGELGFGGGARRRPPRRRWLPTLPTGTCTPSSTRTPARS